MGLDAVEIVLEVEEAFEISIEDAEAESILTPGELVNLILSKVGRSDRAVCLTQRAFHRLRHALMRRADLPREPIKPKVRMASLLERDRRQELMRSVLDEVGIAAMPEFVRPGWLVNLCVGITIAASVVAAGLVWLASFTSELSGGVGLAAGFVVLVITGKLLARLTRGQCREFKPAMATVGGFSRWIVAHGPEVVQAPPGQWSREQVSARVREIVIGLLDCEENYREDARFIQDLGLG